MAGFPQLFGVGSVQTLTDAATITLDLSKIGGPIPPATTPVTPGTGNSFAVTLGGNRTLNILNAVDGQVIYLYVTQDGTGSRTLAVQNGGTAGAALVATGTLLTTTAAAIDLVEIVYRGDLGKSFVSAIGRAYA